MLGCELNAYDQRKQLICLETRCTGCVRCCCDRCRAQKRSATHSGSLASLPHVYCPILLVDGNSWHAAQDVSRRNRNPGGARKSTTPISRDISDRLTVGLLTLSPSRSEVRRGSRRIHLTEREFHLLAFLMQNQGRLMSDPEIAVHLRQRFREVALARVEIYVRQLRQKVDESFGQALNQRRAEFRVRHRGRIAVQAVKNAYRN